MKCRVCGADTRVRETRERAEGFYLMRVRVCNADASHSFKTIEVDDALEATIMKHAMQPRRIGRLKRQVDLYHRNQQILARIRAGEKHEVLAIEFGLSNNMVTTIANRAGIRRKVSPSSSASRR